MEDENAGTASAAVEGGGSLLIEKTNNTKVKVSSVSQLGRDSIK